MPNLDSSSTGTDVQYCTRIFFGRNFLYMVLDRHEIVLAHPFMWALVAALAPQMEQVSPLPWVTPPVPEPVVAGDVNKDELVIYLL